MKHSNLFLNVKNDKSRAQQMKPKMKVMDLYHRVIVLYRFPPVHSRLTLSNVLPRMRRVMDQRKGLFVFSLFRHSFFGNFRTTRTRSASVFNNWLSHWYSYIPFVSSTPSNDLSVTQSIFVLFTLPFRFLKTTLLPSPLSITSISSSEEDVGSSASESSLSTPSSPPPLFRSIYDLYIAAGTTDQNWLKSFALPMLEEKKLKHTMRQTDCEDDQSDGLYDIHLRKQSTVLFYMINGHERLSQLATELAFLIGERKYKIVVYLETSIDEHSNTILSPCERRDIQRSRKYLEDIAMKENIFLSNSREQCWRHVLTYFQNSDD